MHISVDSLVSIFITWGYFKYWFILFFIYFTRGNISLWSKLRSKPGPDPRVVTRWNWPRSDRLKNRIWIRPLKVKPDFTVNLISIFLLTWISNLEVQTGYWPISFFFTQIGSGSGFYLFQITNPDPWSLSRFFLE